MADTSWPRHARITDDNHGPLVNIASWSLVCCSILFTGFRIISNVLLRGGVAKDDWVICLSTLFAIAQTIATSSMVGDGVGRHEESLSQAAIDRYQQSLLASSILYVTTLACSKFSLLYFLDRLISSPQTRFKLLLRASWVTMLGYLVAEVFTLAFQCQLPRVFDYIDGPCIDIKAFWTFDAAFDVFSGLLILAMPIIIISPLQMPVGRKFQAISAFIFQIPCCAFAVVRVVYVYRDVDAADHTWAAVSWAIWTSINVHFNVIVANIPCLKIFLDGFQSSLFHQGVENQISSTHNATYGSNPKSRLSQIGGSGGRGRDNDRRFEDLSSENMEERGLTASDLRPYEGESNATITSTPSMPRSEGEEPSRSDGITTGQIRMTTEWSVLRSAQDGQQVHRRQA